MLDKEYLTFDDILLVPQYSEVMSRSDVDLTSGRLGLSLPIISANMDTVTEENMAIAMSAAGGMGIIHRFLTPERLDQIITRCKITGTKFGVSLGIGGDSSELLDVAIDKASIFCIDVAHGHHHGVIEKIDDLLRLKRGRGDITIIAGNVATPKAVQDLARAGADIIKVGVGPGSHCTTRVVTGHGFPQFSALLECCAAAKDIGVEIIADGGIRNSGDIAKAIAAGADYVMVGRLLAGTDEAPGQVVASGGRKAKVYRGMASFEAQQGRPRAPRTPEGVASAVEYSGSVAAVLEGLAGGLRSAYSYTGAMTTSQYKKLAKFIRVTSASHIEGTPHGAI